MGTKNRFASAETNDEIKNTELFSAENNLMRGGAISIHPSLLKYPKLNYVKIKKGDKRCIEVRWNTRVIPYWNSSLRQHLKDGGMHGVQTNNSIVEIDGIDRHLLIIDFDSREFQDKVIDKFPETLTTSSGSKKNCNHLILGTDRQEKKFSIVDEEGNTLCDVLGQHGQIVAPNSIHTSGSVYRVVKDIPIAYISYDKVLEIFKPYMKEDAKEVQCASLPKKDYGSNSFYDQVKRKLSIPEVLEKNGIDTQKNPTECPLHSSESGECLSFTRDMWKCHHGGCEKGGNVFTLVKAIYGLDNKETFEKLAELTGLEDELQEERANYMKREASE